MGNTVQPLTPSCGRCSIALGPGPPVTVTSHARADVQSPTHLYVLNVPSLPESLSLPECRDLSNWCVWKSHVEVFSPGTRWQARWHVRSLGSCVLQPSYARGGWDRAAVSNVLILCPAKSLSSTASSDSLGSRRTFAGTFICRVSFDLFFGLFAKSVLFRSDPWVLPCLQPSGCLACSFTCQKVALVSLSGPIRRQHPLPLSQELLLHHRKERLAFYVGQGFTNTL